MTRTRRALRIIRPVGNNTFADQTIVSVVGGGRPHKVMSVIEHARYMTIVSYIDEETAKREGVPHHDAVYLDPTNFAISYLKRVR